ncbi:unnamed protein product [Trichobilharzia szidati]|nr:unnamed protein product [Trichobilharzia szidati]
MKNILQTILCCLLLLLSNNNATIEYDSDGNYIGKDSDNADNGETQPVANQSESTASAGTDQQLTTTPQFLSETPETQPVANQSESTASAGTDQQLTTTPQFLSQTPDGADKFINYYDPNSTLDAYADSYRQVVNNKFHMIEIQTYKDPHNVEETIKPEILRLERLYQSKWAKEFLESIGAEDKNLVNLYNDEYKKALEEDKAFNYKVLVNKGLYRRLKMLISRKWENRKNLDIAEDTFFEETSGSLKKYKVQIELTKKDLMEAKKAVNASEAKLKVLETAAVIASNAYRNSSNYLRRLNKEASTKDSLNDEKITQVYWKARFDFADGTDELRDKIKLLEMKRIDFLKCELPSTVYPTFASYLSTLMNQSISE